MTVQSSLPKFFARWIARIDGVSKFIQLGMLGLTGISTATLSLRAYGHGQYAWIVISVSIIGSLVFAFYYTEGGVWNQVNRNKADLSANYSVPTMYVNQMLQIPALYSVLYNREPTKQELERAQEIVLDQWKEYRNGIDID